MKMVVRMVLAALLLGSVAYTQSQPAQPCVPAGANAPQDTESHGKLGKMMNAGPSITVEIKDGERVCPLSAHDKLNVWLRRSYTPANFVAAAANAAVWQATEGREGYGQGWDAYGSRFGASMANVETATFFQSFLFPAIFHQDPRYFREGQGSFGPRFWHSISQVVIGHTDSGHRTFNASEVFGAFAAAGISRAYYPDEDRNASRTMQSAGFNLASAAGWNLLREFGPDLWRKMRKK